MSYGFRGCRLGGCLIVCALGAALSFPVLMAQKGGSDPENVLQRARELLVSDFLRSPNPTCFGEYSWRVETLTNRLNSNGMLEKTERRTESEIAFSPDGTRIERIIRINGKAVMREKAIDHAFPFPYRMTVETGAKDPVRDAILSLISVRFEGREALHNRESLVFSFEMPSQTTARLLAVKRVLNTKGRLWFDEQDCKLVKVEGAYVDDAAVRIKGHTRKIRKGTEWSWQLIKIDDTAWVPDFWRLNQAPIRPFPFFPKKISQIYKRFYSYERAHRSDSEKE